MPRQYETTFIVTNLDRSIKFYKEVLGLTLVERNGTRATFETGECELVLEGEFDDQTLEAYGLKPPGDTPGRGVLVSLMYDDIDRVYERAAANADAEILTEPRDARWGERLFLVSDPDGYVLDIAEPL